MLSSGFFWRAVNSSSIAFTTVCTYDLPIEQRHRCSRCRRPCLLYPSIAAFVSSGAFQGTRLVPAWNHMSGKTGGPLESGAWKGGGSRPPPRLQRIFQGGRSRELNRVRRRRPPGPGLSSLPCPWAGNVPRPDDTAHGPEVHLREHGRRETGRSSHARRPTFSICIIAQHMRSLRPLRSLFALLCACLVAPLRRCRCSPPAVHFCPAAPRARCSGRHTPRRRRPTNVTTARHAR